MNVKNSSESQIENILGQILRVNYTKSEVACVKNNCRNIYSEYCEIRQLEIVLGRHQQH